MILFHGSNEEIVHIDLDKCRPFKDFGRGFYLTDIQEQATQIAHPAHRFDVVIDPVTNDDIAILFRTFSLGFIDLDTLVRGLEYKKLTRQFLFHTTKAVSLLQNRGTA